MFHRNSRILVECLDFHSSNKLVNSVLVYRDSEWIRLPVYLLVRGDVVALSSNDEERLPKKSLLSLDADTADPRRTIPQPLVRCHGCGLWLM